MVRNWLILLIGIGLVLSACDGGASAYLPKEALVSTPVDDLPVSSKGQQDLAIPTAVPDALIEAADAEYQLLTNIYERIAPSVVNIDVVSRRDSTSILVDISGGSGFIYDKQGHIITNAHVVSDAQEIRVTFNDGYLTQATLVGADTYSDIAVIKVNVQDSRLFPLSLADSNHVRVGQRAIAIGNPFGLASSMTVGIVSGLGRNLRSAELIDANAIPGFQNPSIIQVDTDINPGNSGGPLLNSKGEVVGVNTAIRSNSGTFEGVGFAVPANTVRRVVPELIKTQQVNYPWLGVNSLSSEDGYGVAGLAEELKLPVNAGILISSVIPDSPAEKSGLQGGTRRVLIREQNVCIGGDIIVAVNDTYVNNLDELVAHLVMYNRPGDVINLLIVRGNETFEVEVLLEERPQSIANVTCGGR